MATEPIPVEDQPRFRVEILPYNCLKSQQFADDLLLFVKALYPACEQDGQFFTRMYQESQRLVMIVARPTRVLEGYSDPEGILGMAVAGSFSPDGMQPPAVGYLHFLGVVPDDRRQGIATALLRRYFTHVQKESLKTKAYYLGDREPLEAAAFCMQFNQNQRKSRLLKRADDFWSFQLYSPFVKHVVDPA